MISARRRTPAPQAPRAQGTKAPTHIPFKWAGQQGPLFAPVGGVQAFTSEGEKAVALRETMKQEVQLYKGAEADAFLQDKVADEMAREVAQGVLEEHKARPDRDYNACFQQWLLGKSDVLNNPIITTRGYTSYVERFPRVVNWVDAQVRLASEIKVYLVRLWTEGPRTEEEVEHEFRYLVWPLNNALRILQQARNAPTLGVEVLRGVPGGAWDPQHQTAGNNPWPAELTYMGRVPDSSVKDVPPCLHPALNPYMRDQWVYSVSYREWLAGDYSKLRGDSRELWEVVANRLYGRDDRMQKPAEDAEDPQQEGGWQGAARPAGEWDAPRTSRPCGPAPYPAQEASLVPPSRPWAPAVPAPVPQEEAAPVPSAVVPAEVAQAAAPQPQPARPVKEEPRKRARVEVDDREEVEVLAASVKKMEVDVQKKPEQAAVAVAQAAQEAVAVVAQAVQEAAPPTAMVTVEDASDSDGEPQAAIEEAPAADMEVEEGKADMEVEVQEAILLLDGGDIDDVVMTPAEETALVLLIANPEATSQEDRSLALAVIERARNRKRARNDKVDEPSKKRRLEEGQLAIEGGAAPAAAEEQETPAAASPVAAAPRAVPIASVNFTGLRERISALARAPSLTAEQAAEGDEVLLKLNFMYKAAEGRVKKRAIAQIIREQGNLLRGLSADSEKLLREYRGK